MSNPSRESRGFTFVEILIFAALSGILLAFAVPSFSEATQNKRMAIQINELLASLSFARSEAVSRDDTVSMCQSNDGANCAGNWQDGWIVFVDTNINGQMDDGEQILRVQSGLDHDLFLSFDQERVSFANSGIAIGGVNGTFTLCDHRGETRSRGLVIGASGLPRLATDSNENGAPEDASNADLECAS